MQIATEVYSCKSTTRVVTSLPGDMTSDRFLLATSNLSDNNEIHLVEYNTRNRTVYSERIYKHKGQIFGLASCPYNPELCFAIVGCSSDVKRGVLYKLGNLPFVQESESKDVEKQDGKDGNGGIAEETDTAMEEKDTSLPVNEGAEKAPEGESVVQEVAEEKKEIIKEEENECIPDDKKVGEVEEKPIVLYELAVAPRNNIITAIWHPGNLEEGTLPHEMILVYREGYAGYTVTDEGQLNELFYYPFSSVCTCAAWDPLHTQLLALAHDTTISILNIIDNTVYAEMKHAHTYAITCLEYNYNRPSILCSGGKDGVVNIWHVARNGFTIEKSIQAHTHWVTSVHFNPLHDQLLLTSSTDSSITVWRLFSASSARMKEKQHDDKCVMSLGGTKESVYSACWSNKNMWLFCGCSYDGKLLFGNVPGDEIAVLLDEI